MLTFFTKKLHVSKLNADRSLYFINDRVEQFSRLQITSESQLQGMMLQCISFSASEWLLVHVCRKPVFCVTEIDNLHTGGHWILSTNAWKSNFYWLFELRAIHTTASKVWKVYRNLPWPPKLCICLDRQNISPLCSLSLYPNKGIQMWMWSRGTTSVFPVDICKTLYCQFWRDPASC